MAQATASQKAITDRQRYSRRRNDDRKHPRVRCGMLVANAKSRANASGLEFSLTPAIVHVWMVEQNYSCKQTGIPFVFEQIGSKRSLAAPSLDRIDCTQGYTIKNTQLVCLFYNIAKNNSTDEQVWSMMRHAVAYRDGVA
jgi:hypothetical protein